MGEIVSGFCYNYPPHRKNSMQNLTGIIEKDGDWYVALCPELDVASQGKSIAEARTNLVEAVELFFECADDAEIQRRMARKF